MHRKGSGALTWNEQLAPRPEPAGHSYRNHALLPPERGLRVLCMAGCRAVYSSAATELSDVKHFVGLWDARVCAV